MEYKKFFKNTSMKRGDQIRVEVSRQNQIQRAKSRHEMRQTFRNMGCDSEEENDVPPANDLFRPQQMYQHVTINNKNFSEDERYRIRLQRLQQFHEQKRRKQEGQRSKQKVQFLPFSGKNVGVPKQISPSTKSASKKVIPLGERLEQANPIAVGSNKTPMMRKKHVKPRVDCWRTERIENGPPRKPLSEKKTVPVKPVERPVIPKPALKRSKESQQPVVVKQQVKTVRNALPRSQTAQPTGRPLSQKKQLYTVKLKPPVLSDTGTTSKVVTSTVRKHRKPLTFSFEPTSEIKQQKATITVYKTDDLFDGISPIEVESSPLANSPTKVIDVRCSSPVASAVVPKPLVKEDSLWEPQPVACLSVIEATVHENVNPATVDSRNIVPLQRDCSVSDWVPAAVHEITNDTIVIDDEEDDDEVFKKTTYIPSIPVQEDRTRKPALNESFTISVGTVARDDVPTIDSSGPTVVELSPPQTVQITDNVFPVAAKQQETNQSIESDRNRSPKDNELNGSMVRKRASLIFTEEPIDCDIVPSKSNLTLEEKRRSSLGEEKNSSTSEPSRRRSSVCLSDPALMSPEEPEDATPPKDVQEKTRFYYGKVDGEVNRLQALCDQYAPFLETEQELNDHCRGLILAAQGQTNILIKKKLSKFRELIGHYEMKWNDRKVRHDDLDGFWVMLALDLDNLDKRFEELRLLKENNWQEVIPEPPPKVKKLLAGGGVRKREKKPSAANGKKGSSSVIADLIRKARREQQKQKTTVGDLDALKETVTVVTTPVKRSVRFGESPARTSSLQQRSSVCTGFSPITVYWDEEPKIDRSKRHTIFPDITRNSERVKSILKPSAKVSRTRRAKSVLFLDSGLDTPQTRRRDSSRTIVDTPKPKIKFNDELEIELIDNLAARTPSRLEVEIQKRRNQSLLESVSLQQTFNENNGDDYEQKKKARKPRGTSRPDSSAVRRSNRSRSKADFDEESHNNNDSNAEEDEKDAGKRSKRSSRNARKKILVD